MRSSIVSIQPNDERSSHDRSAVEATWAHKLKSYLGTSRTVVAKKVQQQQGPARFRVIVPLKPDNLISHASFFSFFILRGWAPTNETLLTRNSQVLN